MFRTADRAYLAGVIDGEGSIGIDYHGGHRTPSIRITITNTNLNLLAEIKAVWGGNLASWRKRKAGWKACSDLIWGGRPSTDKILKAVKPYLKAKKKQCQIALEFNRTVDSTQTRGVPPEIQAYRQELRRKMLEANKRGAKQPSQEVSE